MKNFQIILKVKNQYIIRNESNYRKLQAYLDGYDNHEEFEQIQIYARKKKNYELIFNQNRRKIGF